MANSNPIRFGENSQNAVPTSSDLWLPLFGGELLAAYDENQVVKSLVNSKTISTGTTLKFPRSWKMTAERHAAGTEMLGLPLSMGEISISVDDRPIVSFHDLDDIDVKMSHFEMRSEIARQMASAISRVEEKNVASLLVLASRTADPANGPFIGGGTDGNGTALIDSTLAATSNPHATASRDAAGAFLKALDTVALRWMQNDIDVPEEGRSALIKPELWLALHTFGVPVAASEMYGAGATAGPLWFQPGFSGPAASAALNRKMALNYHGFTIYQSPFIPSTNVTTGPSKYQGNFTNTLGVVFQRDAVAYLSLMGMKSETFRDVRRQTDFVVASILGGGGTLRPTAAVELASA